MSIPSQAAPTEQAVPTETVLLRSFLDQFQKNLRTRLKEAVLKEAEESIEEAVTMAAKELSETVRMYFQRDSRSPYADFALYIVRNGVPEKQP